MRPEFIWFRDQEQTITAYSEPILLKISSTMDLLIFFLLTINPHFLLFVFNLKLLSDLC